MNNHAARIFRLNMPLLLAVATIAALPIVIGERPLSAQAVFQEPRPIPAIPATPPGYRIGEIKVTGVKFVKSEFLQGGLGIVSGQPLDPLLLRKGFGELKMFYGSLGFADFIPVAVLELDEQKKVVNVTVNVDEGRQFFVNRFSFAGNTTTPDEVIRREVVVKEGYVFDARALETSRLRLNTLGLFEEIKIEDISVRLFADERKLDVELRLREKRR